MSWEPSGWNSVQVEVLMESIPECFNGYEIERDEVGWLDVDVSGADEGCRVVSFPRRTLATSADSSLGLQVLWGQSPGPYVDFVVTE